MRNKEHIAATNHLCQINDLGSPGNTLVGNYCPFLGGSGMGNINLIKLTITIDKLMSIYNDCGINDLLTEDA